MVEKIKYLGTAVTNKNSIQKEIKSRVGGVRECLLLSFGAEYFVFQVAIQKFKD